MYLPRPFANILYIWLGKINGLLSIVNPVSLLIKNSLYSCGKNARFGKDLSCIRPALVSIGDNFRCENFVRIHCWALDSVTKGYKIYIGNNVYINSFSYVSALSMISISDRVLIGSNVLISDNSHGSTTYIEEERTSARLVSKGRIHIGKGVWIGNNCVVLGGVTIGENTIIGANSVVTKSLPGNAICAGAPCKVLRYLKS